MRTPSRTALGWGAAAIAVGAGLALLPEQDVPVPVDKTVAQCQEALGQDLAQPVEWHYDERRVATSEDGLILDVVGTVTVGDADRTYHCSVDQRPENDAYAELRP